MSERRTNVTILVMVIAVILAGLGFYFFREQKSNSHPRKYQSKTRLENSRIRELSPSEYPIRKTNWRQNSVNGILESDNFNPQLRHQNSTINTNSNFYPSENEHPVLKYQRRVSAGTWPANLGDPIRPYPSAGPLNDTTYRMSEGGDLRALAYGRYSGPSNQKPMYVPVPAGTLKLSNESSKYPFYSVNIPLKPADFFRPYGPNTNVNSQARYADTPFYTYSKKNFGTPTYFSNISANGDHILEPSVQDISRKFHFRDHILKIESQPFVASVNAFAPFPEVYERWEKIGSLTTIDINDDSILNLHRMPVAPLQDLFQYSVQDKNGFIIPLKGITFLEDGDIVPRVIGKESKGPWKANIFVNNKYVWT
jgi:hypothetical protein